MARKLLGNGIDQVIPDDGLRQGQAAEFRDRTFGQGSGAPGTLVGKQNAVWADVDLTGLTLTDVRVPHSLGAIAVTCEFVEVVRGGGAGIYPSVQPIIKDRWDRSQCRVSINLNGGTQTGTVLKFRISGQ